MTRLRPAVPAVLAGAFVALAASLFWWRFNSEPRAGARAIFLDLVNYYHPMADLVATRLAALELPLWNPTACGGIPLLATLQVGAFYPPNLLALALGAETGITLSMFVHGLLGGGFTCWAFRASGSTWPGAAFGGALFVFACVIGETAFPAQVATLVWLPWLLLCVARFVATGAARWWLGLSLGTALQILAGFPQLVLLSFYLVGPWALLQVWQCHRGPAVGRLRLLGAMAIAVAIGVGLAGAQLGPSLELAGESVRAGGLDEAEVHYLASGVRRADGFLRNALDPAPRRLTFDYGPGAGYLGVPALFFVAIALVSGWRSPWTVWWLGVAVLALLLSDGFRGAASDLYRLYAATPGGSVFRTPERFRLLALFAAIALAVRGLDTLARGFPGLGRSAPRRWAAGAALALLGTTLVGLGAEGVAWRVAAVGLALVIVLSWPDAAGARRAALAGLLGLGLLDLGLAVGPYGFYRALPIGFATPPPERYVGASGSSVDAELVAALRADPPFGRIELVRFMPKLGAGALAGLQRPSCFEPLVPAAWPAVFEALTGQGASGIASVDPDRHPDFYDLTSVRRLVVSERGVARVIENPDALPRAYLVERSAVRSQAETFAALASGDLDLRGRVAVEREPGWALRPEDGRPGEATISAQRAEWVAIDLRTRRDAVLVLTDSYYPGWRARVDGEPAPIVRANGLFRAVPVPAGARRVEMEYTPDSFRRGLAVSGASGVALVVVAPWLRRAKLLA